MSPVLHPMSQIQYYKMSLFVTALNSGSNGNCYYVGNDEEAVFIDAGISCRETERRMSRLGLSMDKVKAIFISHEHSDHIKGIKVLAKKFHLPVYITPATLQGARVNCQELDIRSFEAFQPVQIGSLSIEAFPKFHDASDPHSFVVSCGGINVGVFTDIGIPCEQLVKYFKKCHAAFLEANYDDDMLRNGRYPLFLQQRIRNGKGHLSNQQALEFYTANRPRFLSHLFLSHLSKDNNCPELVMEMFRPGAAGTEIVVASRHEEIPVYTIKAGV